MRGCQAYMVLGNDCLFTAKPRKPALRSSLQHNTSCFPSPSLALSFQYLVSFLTTLQAFHLFHSCCEFMSPLSLLTSQRLISNATSSRKPLQILRVGFASLSFELAQQHFGGVLKSPLDLGVRMLGSNHSSNHRYLLPLCLFSK